MTWVFAALLTLAPLLTLPFASLAGANQPIVVTTVDDPGDGDCATNGCTLREAIELANARARADTIEFAILGGGAQTITPTSPLPEITGRVTIDGYTQAEAQENTIPLATDGTDAQLRIVLDGTNAGDSAAGLTLGGGSRRSVIRGLVINHFDPEGIAVNAAGVRIEGNFVGTDASGTAGAGNQIAGVAVYTAGEDVIVGGSQPEQRNLISGNNVTSGDTGVWVDAKRVTIQGNLVGTERSGTGALGNDRGIQLRASKALVGGTRPAEGNVIAFNDTKGVGVASLNVGGNRILGNSLFANGAAGIELGDSGLEENDPKDRDTGANRLQNFPDIVSFGGNATELVMNGQLNSNPESTFILQIFSTPPTDGADEGRTLIGQITVKTNKKGKANWEFRREMIPVPAHLTMTATNKKTGDTSAFSPSVLMS